MAECIALVNKNVELTEEEKMALEFCRTASGYFHGIEGKIYALPSLRKGRDMDLVVWMHFDRFNTKIRTGYINKTDSQEPLEVKLRLQRDVWFNSALITIELKKHDTGEGISIKHGKLYVKYREEWHDASEQSFKQSFALQSYLKERLNIEKDEYTPLAQNIIWLYRCFDKPTDDGEVDNVIFGELNMRELIEKLLKLRPPLSNDKGKNIIFDIAKGDLTERMDDFFENLRKEKANGIGKISRNKLEQIVKKGLENEEGTVYNNIGKKLTIIKGKPGTGKTIFLVKLTNHLEIEECRPVLLTYNRALVQDIHRLIYYSEGRITAKMNITTIHSFFYQILIENEIVKESNSLENDYLTKYESYLSKLLEQLSQFSDAEEIRMLLRMPYDTVLVDEAQDCLELEKDIIFKIFGWERSIVSYGNKQIVRQDDLDWGTNIKSNNKSVVNLKISYRNKNSLVDFFNNYSRKINNGLEWGLKENHKLVGGKIVIFIGPYSYSKLAHQKYAQTIVDEKYSMYDMMFFTPSMNHGIDYADELEENILNWGYKAFNSTSPEKKKQRFPVDEHRIINFHSCRGLEAWITVLWRFDLMLKEIEKYYKHDNNSGCTFEEGLKAYTDNWVFMLFTRAIDTLVLTVHDANSKEAQTILWLAESQLFSHMAQIVRAD